MAASLPGVPVIVGRKRRLSAVTAVREFAPDLLILDDGFQHWPIERDVNLVLWDAALLPKDASLNPLGPLREPLSALRRADAILFTRPSDGERLARAKSQIDQIAPGLPHFAVHFEPDAIVSLDGRSALTTEEITEKKFFAFCGLARPEKFSQSIEKTGAQITGTADFSDHHYYTARDLQRLSKKAAQTDADALITTAKDAVKLRKLTGESELPIYVLTISPRFDPADDDQNFLNWLQEKLKP
jgi:tetraacyldisaccharide 4'-kinase